MSDPRSGDLPVRRVALGFEPVDVPSQFPMPIRAFAYGAVAIAEGLYAPAKEGSVETPYGLVEYEFKGDPSADYAERTLMRHILRNNVSTLERHVGPLELVDKTENGNQLLKDFLARNVIYKATGVFGPLALSGSRVVPAELTRDLATASQPPEDGQPLPPMIVHRQRDVWRTVAYRPLRQQGPNRDFTVTVLQGLVELEFGANPAWLPQAIASVQGQTIVNLHEAFRPQA